VILDGTIIPCDRCKEPAISTKGEVIDLWYSVKAHAHGGNIQAVLAPDGFPLWVSDVEPGSVHDITAARTHALPALYRGLRAGSGTGRLSGLADARASSNCVPGTGTMSPAATSLSFVSQIPIRRITRWPPHVTPTRPARTKRSEPSRHLIHHSSRRELPARLAPAGSP
jgi:hypothetical protein